MKWNETNYPRIGETVLRTTLPNGLTVAVVPKPLYRKRYAFFTTRYGGMDMRFRLDGVWHNTPAGIAHYLEHKMFDTEDGNALQELSQNGAEPNAFTSNATTAYYFDCTEHFEENLRILLSFVSVPYFTQESVDKERGIIGQEIRMVEDTPDWRVYTNLLECLYHSSPARVAIAGTVESIAEITPETLYACHKAFYDPANMMLCVVGDVKPDEIAAIAEEILPESRGEVIERDYGQEDMRVVEKFRREAMEVSMPQFLVGFKCPPAADGAALMRQDIIADIACDILLGDSSPLYQRLYDKGLINGSFGGGFFLCRFLFCGDEGGLGLFSFSLVIGFEVFFQLFFVFKQCVLGPVLGTAGGAFFFIFVVHFTASAHPEIFVFLRGELCRSFFILCHFGEIALILCTEVFVLHDVRDFRLFGEIFKQQ